MTGENSVVASTDKENVIDLAEERKKRRKSREEPQRPKVRLTATNWETLPNRTPGGKWKDIYQCSHKDRFALVINPGGERSWGMVMTVENGERRTKILGKCKQVPITAAHKKMDRIVRHAVSTGADISARVEKRGERSALKLRAAHAEFITVKSDPRVRKPLAESSAQRYGYALESLIEALGGSNDPQVDNVAFWNISRDDCRKAHAMLSNPKWKSKVRQRARGGLVAANFALHYLELLWAFHAPSYEKAGICPVISVKNRMGKAPARDGWIEPEFFMRWWQLILSIKMENGLTSTDPVWMLYFFMAVLTGRRRTELLKLQWAMVDFKRATYTIVKGNAKNREQITYPMGRWLTRQLQKLRASQEESTEWVFAYPEITRLSGVRLPPPDRVIRQKIRKHPDFTEFDMHDTRRTFGTITVCAAVETPLLTHHKMMNHKIKDQTGEYAKINADMMRPYIQRVENVMLALSRCETKDAALDVITHKMEDKRSEKGTADLRFL